MSLGYDREQNVFNLNDTAVVLAFLYDSEDNPVALDDVLSVTFTIQKPDGTSDTEVGFIEDDGGGKLLWNDTDLVGQYTVIAAFATPDGTRSTRADFEVIDPLDPPVMSKSYIAAVWGWRKFEDCFDAEDEGPWLRDVTLNFFNKSKMEEFIDEALLDINLQNPPTNLVLDYFVADPVGSDPPTATSNIPLLAHGIALAVIRHLMRSYVEQPNPVGMPIAWHDRRDYLQRWQTVYQIEQQQYMRTLALFKRSFLQLGRVAMLVSSKAGRLIPAPMRTRNVGRGYW